MAEAPWEVDPPRFEEYQRAHGWRYRVAPAALESGGFYMSMAIGFPRAQLSAVVAALAMRLARRRRRCRS